MDFWLPLLCVVSASIGVPGVFAVVAHWFAFDTECPRCIARKHARRVAEAKRLAEAALPPVTVVVDTRYVQLDARVNTRHGGWA